VQANIKINTQQTSIEEFHECFRRRRRSTNTSSSWYSEFHEKNREQGKMIGTNRPKTHFWPPAKLAIGISPRINVRFCAGKQTPLTLTFLKIKDHELSGFLLNKISKFYFTANIYIIL